MVVRGCHLAEEVQYVVLVVIEGARIMALYVFVDYVWAAEVGKMSLIVVVQISGLFCHVFCATGSRHR